MNDQMKAVMYEKYGAPDVLKLTNVQKPVPQENEVLIKTFASTVSATDVIFRSGSDLSARIFTGLFKPKYTMPGSSFAGEVVAVGNAVQEYQIGDRVTGTTSPNFAANAEYVCLPQDSAMVTIPDNLTFEEAVAIHPGALTALPNLRDAADTRSGQKILINGASGSIGSSAVQLAKHFGAEVTAVCSSGNAALVKSLGADMVIDYKVTDFTKTDQSYDIVFDAIGKSSFSQCKGLLNPGGIYLTTVLSPGILGQKFWTSRFGNKRADIIFAGLRSNSEKDNDLRFIVELARSRAFRPVIDRCYPLEEIADAHNYVETGRKKGHVVLVVGHDQRV